MAVSSLLILSLCPNRRAGLWLGRTAGGWVISSCDLQSPGDRERRWVKSLVALVAVSAETRTMPLAAPYSHCSLVIEPTFCFLFPKGEVTLPSSLTETRSWREISETLLLPPWAQKIPGTTQVVSHLVSGRFLLVTQNWGQCLQAKLTCWVIKNQERHGEASPSETMGSPPTLARLSPQPLSWSSPQGATDKMLTSSPCFLTPC